MADSNMRLTTAKQLISQGANVCYEADGQHHGTNSPAITEFQFANNDYRILCGGGVCRVQQWVPKILTFTEELLEAIGSFGLLACSSAEAPREWKDIAEVSDAPLFKGPDIGKADTQDVSDAGDVVKDTSTTCSDSDGKNYYTAGFVVTNAGTTAQKLWQDICKDSTFLYEQVCEEGRKQLIIRCSDVLPGGQCVQDSTGGKCVLASEHFVDAGSVDSDGDSPDMGTAADTGSELPNVLVDYLATTPVPFASDKSFNTTFSGWPICGSSTLTI